MTRFLLTAACLGFLGLSGCSDLNTLADGSPSGMHNPSDVPADARAMTPSAMDAPAEMKAKGVIKPGDTQGTYNGQVYHCGNADCSIAVRTPYPVPGGASSSSN